ncbi:MAG: diguanylate cyclase [Gammaproteobacteria bacterium]
MADITNLIAYSVRIQLPNFDHPIYLIEFHPREECFQAFATLNRLYQIQSRHEKESLATNMLLQRAVSESRIDPLTKITNRRALDEHLIAVWEQAFHCSLPFSFLMLDLDFFKKINDLFGHAQGDFVLVKVAETLTKNLNRTGDVVARFGGEEFSAILPNTDIVGAKHISNKLLFAVQHLKIPNPGSDISEHVTVSVGGYTMKPTKREADLSSVIRYADRALYRAKANGRNCAVHYGVFSALS